MSKTSNEDSAIKELQKEHSKKMAAIRQEITQNHEQYLSRKEAIGEKFDEELLKIIKRSHELTATMKREEERLANIMDELRLRNS